MRPRLGIFGTALALLATAAFIAAAPTATAQDRTFVTIGTGGVTGVYYPTGGAICRLVNKAQAEHNIRCTVESTAASVYNINAVDKGELSFGITQADWEYHARQGTSKFAEQGPMEKLRAVFSLHAESITVVARADSGINGYEDFKGKRVNVGDPGSGALATNEMLFERYGMSFDDLALAAKLKSAEQAAALCDGKIDAYAWIVGHPSAGVSEATSTCDAKHVPVQGPVIDKLIEEKPFYSKTTVPGGMYEGNPESTPTFGMRAVLVTSSDVSENVVYHLTKAVFENLDEFRAMHPALANLDKKAMVTQGILAPVHRGARQYYKEAGLQY